MCKQEGLHLDQNEVLDILRGDYAYVCVRGIGGKQMRFVDAMDKLPLLFFKKVLILVEFNPNKLCLILKCFSFFFYFCDFFYLSF